MKADEVEVETLEQKRDDRCRSDWHHSDVLGLTFLIHCFSLLKSVCINIALNSCISSVTLTLNVLFFFLQTSIKQCLKFCNKNTREKNIYILSCSTSLTRGTS